MIKKIFMVSTVVVLVFLIIITPTFISERQPLGSVPSVFIDNMKYSVLIDVHSVVVEYRFRNISMRVTGLESSGYHPPPLIENDTYDLHVVVWKNDTLKFDLNITLFDQNRRGFDYNVTVEVKGEGENNIMLISRPDSDQSSTVALGATFKDTLSARRVGG
jgi:hypothetical protein